MKKNTVNIYFFKRSLLQNSLVPGEEKNLAILKATLETWQGLVIYSQNGL